MKNSAVFLIIAILISGFLSCTIERGGDIRRYALVYGVGEYASVNDLPFATNDGIDVRSLLEAQGYTIINPGSSEAATRADLEADMAEARSVVGPRDVFLFYFAGHGLQLIDKSDGLIAFSDYSGIDSPGALFTSELLDSIKAMGAFHNILILDACNSGTFIEESFGVTTLPDSYVHSTFTDASEGGGGLSEAISNYFGINAVPNISVMTAAGPSEESYEWSGAFGSELARALGVPAEYADNGVFTGFFLEAAANADANVDGRITLSEAYNHIYRRIDSTWNAEFRKSLYSEDVFYPHISGGGLDPVLFILD